MKNHSLLSGRRHEFMLLLFAFLFLLQGCSDDGRSDQPTSGHTTGDGLDENNEADSERPAAQIEAPSPEGLGEAELYSIRLRQHVVLLDNISRFDEVRVSQSYSCDDETEQSDADILRFGYPCTSLFVDFSRRETLEVGVDDYVFSSKHRVMGKVVSINTANPDSRGLKIQWVQMDEIFDHVRIKATVSPDTAYESTIETMQNQLQVHRQALMLDSQRSFNFERGVEHNFGSNSNTAVVTGTFKLEGQVILDAHFGFSVPDEQEYINVEFDMESSIAGGFDFESGYDNVREAETTLVSFSTPIRLGWFFGDIVYEAKAKLDANFDAQIGVELEWQSDQVVSSRNNWTQADGWNGEADVEIGPLQTHADFNVSAELTATMGIDFSTSVMIYKLLGPKVAVTPKLSATAKGEVWAANSDGEVAIDGQGCLTVKGLIDIELSGVVRGLEDTSLYEQSLVEQELISRGMCDETTLPLDEIPPRRDGFQFSVSSTSPGGRCDDFSGGLDAQWEDYLRSKAQRCIASSRCILSLQPCAARFPNRPKRGVCTVVDYPVVYTYYSDVNECPELPQEGFAPCTLLQEQQWGNVSWAPSC